MKVCALVHMYPALGHHAGAEWMLHTLLRHLAAEGDQADVFVDSTAQPEACGTWDGVTVYKGFPAPALAERYDVAITHLDETLNAARICQASGTPLVHIVHNHAQLGYHGITNQACQLAVFNSRWLAERVHFAGRSMVCHPPVFSRDYRAGRTLRRSAGAGDVTLVNLSHAKGAGLFYDLAHREPERSFRGVIGSYGPQTVRFDIPNVAVCGPTGEIARQVYARTRVLLMPSHSESYGRCAVEAMASGIPVIASDTTGLAEACAGAAILLPATDVDAWQAALRRLDAPEEYGRWAQASLDRAAQLDVESAVDVRRLRRAMRRLVRQRAVV